MTAKPSRGGLEVEAWTDNSLHSASVGSNPSVYGVSIARVIEILLTTIQICAEKTTE